MSDKITIRHAAEKDLADEWTYLNERNPGAAERFLTAVRTMFELLVASPGIGPLRDFGNPALSGTRMKPVAGFEKYLIFYRPIDGGIEVIRVLHAARNIARLMRRER